MKCPYKILGISRKATGKTIKKRYHVLVMKLHPDRNPGDEESPAKFQEVQQAYDLLMNEERRARYDATGILDEDKADNSINEIMMVLSQCLVGLLQEAHKNGVPMGRFNLIDSLKSTVNQTLKDLAENKKKIEALSVMFGEVALRASVSEGTNLLAEISLAKIKEIENGLLIADAEIARFSKAKQFLKKCGYRLDLMAAYGIPTGATTTSWTTY